MKNDAKIPAFLIALGAIGIVGAVLRGIGVPLNYLVFMGICAGAILYGMICSDEL